MKFRTRILITFLTIILLPSVLALTAFLLIGTFLARGQAEYGFDNRDYNVWIDPTAASRIMSDEIFREAEEKLKNNPKALEDEEILSYLEGAISLEEAISKYENMNAMEIVNGDCVTMGYADYNATAYDTMLMTGKRIYCIAADDNHNKYPLNNHFDILHQISHIGKHCILCHPY